MWPRGNDRPTPAPLVQRRQVPPPAPNSAMPRIATRAGAPGRPRSIHPPPTAERHPTPGPHRHHRVPLAPCAGRRPPPRCSAPHQPQCRPRRRSPARSLATLPGRRRRGFVRCAHPLRQGGRSTTPRRQAGGRCCSGGKPRPPPIRRSLPPRPRWHPRAGPNADPPTARRFEEWHQPRPCHGWGFAPPYRPGGRVGHAGRVGLVERANARHPDSSDLPRRRTAQRTSCVRRQSSAVADLRRPPQSPRVPAGPHRRPRAPPARHRPRSGYPLLWHPWLPTRPTPPRAARVVAPVRWHAPPREHPQGVPTVAPRLRSSHLSALPPAVADCALRHGPRPGHRSGSHPPVAGRALGEGPRPEHPLHPDHPSRPDHERHARHARHARYAPPLSPRPMST